MATHILKAGRELMLRSVEGLSEEQLLEVPQSHKNNILWNLGHVAVVQQLLHYGPSRLPLHIPNELVRQFKPGTSPADWDTPPDTAGIRQLLIELPDRFMEDYADGKFSTCREYTTLFGITLSTIDEAIAFTHLHEGIHLGVILSLKKKL
jgi:hypothetical protein